MCNNKRINLTKSFVNFDFTKQLTVKNMKHCRRFENLYRMSQNSNENCLKVKFDFKV